MSLDTVLKIGNILRNSREKMSFSNAVTSCPKDNKGCWPFCLCLPVDKDFNIIFDKASIVPENQRNNLYYLKYKTSGNDTSCKYMFGDIYYSVKGTLSNNGAISISEDGNYRLAKSQSSFDKGNADYESICSSLDFPIEETTELKQIRTGFGREQTMLERILRYAPAIICYFDNQKGSFKEYIDNEVNLKKKCILINKEDNKKKLEKLNAYKNDVDDDEEYQNFLLRLNNASILITAKPKAHAFKNEMCFPLTKTKCELKKHPNSKFECFFNDFNRTKTSLFLPFPSKLIQDNLVCVLELQE